MAGSITKYKLNGQFINPPKEWPELEVLATFEQDDIQANISIESFTFVNEAAQVLREWKEGGKNGGIGTFEGPSFEIIAENYDNTITIFEGFVNLVDGYVEVDPTQVIAKIEKEDGLQTLLDRAKSLDFGFLEFQGVITQADYKNVDFLVEKPRDFIALTTISLAIYSLSKELAEAIKDVAKQAKDLAAAIANTPFNIGLIIGATALFLINLAYATFILIQLIRLIDELISFLISRVRTHKATKFITLLEKSINYLGYDLETSISELENYVYLPGNNSRGGTKGFVAQILNVGDEIQIASGIPSKFDFGYKVDEFYSLITGMFEARFAIIGNTVHVRSKKDPFWKKKASYVLPDVLDERKYDNASELRANRIISFTPDYQDSYTIDNWKGTTFEAITTQINSINPKRSKLKGRDERQYPLALGSRKESLSEVEKAVKIAAEIADLVINALGGNGNNASKIKDRVGKLIISNEIHSIAKVLYMEGDEIPKNHREKLSAKHLYNNYINYESFVANNFARQRRPFPGVEIPFGLNDYVTLIENSFFTTKDGKEGKFTKIQWATGSDFAVVDYWIEEIFDRNLQETFIEPT